jgi:cytochrome bd-type quinol oxidase subunit 2
MTTSKTIAGLIGPTLVAIAAGMLLNIGSLPTLAEQVSRDPALIFVSGILLFVAGLAIVRVHNRWTNGWPVLVTVLGWLAVLGGLARMLFPNRTGFDCRRNWPDHRRDHCRSHRPPGARRLSLVQGTST